MRLIVTDLDGTLIDHHTYSADAAIPALRAAKAAGVPVVPCSSKTLGEMRALAVRLDLAPAPLIVENGGAVWFPASWASIPDKAQASVDGGRVLVLGLAAADLQPLLAVVAADAGVTASGFSSMTDAEVAERTGLPLETAALARRRAYSEPFVCAEPDADLARLDAAARAHGARVTRGGRFFHLIGPTDKGRAVGQLRATVPGARILGLGDAPNDLALLQASDEAVIVPQPGGVHPDLVSAVPRATQASAPGPAGWGAAVIAWLDASSAVVTR